MAQRKTPSTPGKPDSAKAGSSGRPGSTRPGSARSGATSTSARPGGGGRPPARKPGKSIVNQKQTPWMLISVVVVLVLFAGAIIAYAVTRSSNKGGMSTSKADKNYVRPEIAAAKAIPGVIYKQEPKHTHVPGTVQYDTSPPIGGDHSQFWANCNGTVYTKQIANENAVHMLEHGAVWITYNPKTATKADITALTQKVNGVPYTALSPYAGLKTPISLQAWDYQLFVNKASDPRIDQFINALRQNSATTPEANASCSDPQFNPAQSYPGHPFEG